MAPPPPPPSLDVAVPSSQEEGDETREEEKAEFHVSQIKKCELYINNNNNNYIILFYFSHKGYHIDTTEEVESDNEFHEQREDH